MEKIKKIIITVLGWRLVLSLWVMLVVWLLPYKPSFAQPNFLNNFGNRFLTSWANFDGVHYLTITQKGYAGADYIQAFFPLYPLLIYTFSNLINNSLVVGIMISCISLTLSLILIYKLVLLDFDESTGKRTIMLMLLFPTSFFFTAVYSESLFLFFLVGCFYLARKKRWFWAGLVGALAAATRLVGIMLVPALLCEYFLHNHGLMNRTKWWQVLFCFLPILGLGSYSIYLGQVFHNPLLFYDVQAYFGNAREIGKIVLLPQVVYRYLRMFVYLNPISSNYYILVLEFMTAIVGILLICLGWSKMRKSYVIFCSLALLLPSLTGSFLSFPRFVLPLFPLFVIASIKIKSRQQLFMVLTICACLLLVNLGLFTMGLWVA